MSRRPSRRVSQQVSGEAARAVSTGIIALSQPMQVLEVPIDRISPNPDQPRKRFDQAALEALASSIMDKGLLQPVLIKKHPTAEDSFILAAGERRWRAHKHLGRASIRAICVTGDVDEIAVVENAQRADLHPVETAMALRRLSDTRQCTDESLALLTGMSRSDVSKMLAMASLPEEMRHAFLDMAPAPTKSALFEVAMAPEEQRPVLAERVLEGASVAELRRLRSHIGNESVTVGSLRPRPPAKGPNLGRHVKAMAKIVGAMRREGRPLDDQDRDELQCLRDSIDVLLNSST
ncbi:ParB/RepB/Spo0J family partition protein [Caenispirillum salinarum]|uniref:ParB/RepB/Spo0J family partition protein n=1 Tax=Caenispirillum salinarum TaxID=859058 RepID=UPI00384C2F6D